MLVGFESIKLNLLNLHQNNKLHHAILFCGKKGIGKASFAKEIAQEILQSTIQNHPDLLIIEKEEGKREISVEKIRKIADFINQTSAISQYKFIIIDSADELNKSSSNALLKILEEPHNNNFLFLIAHNPNKILPTIRSRCQEIKVADLNFDNFCKILQNFEPKISQDELFFLSDICNNSPAKAIENKENLIDFYRGFLQSLENKKISAEILKIISEKNFAFEIVQETILFFFNRFIKFINNFENDFYFNEKAVFFDLQNNLNKPELFDYIDNITNLLQKTNSLNLDKKLSLINIFNQILKLNNG